MLLWSAIFSAIGTLYPIREAEKPTLEYKKELGRGNQGVVSQVCVKDSPGKEFALKTVSSPRNKNNVEPVVIPKSVENELKILNSLDHPNIIHLESYWEEEHDEEIEGKSVTMHCYNYLLELLNSDVFEYFRENQNVGTPLAIYNANELDIRELYTQIRSAIVYLHSQDVAHVDIKPENILIKTTADGQNIYKLADFGLSTTETTTHMAGTAEVFPPEMYSVYLEDALINLIAEGRVAYDYPANIWRQFREYFDKRIKSIFSSNFPTGTSELFELLRLQYKASTTAKFIKQTIALELNGSPLSSRLNVIRSMRWNAKNVDIFEFGKTLLEISQFFDRGEPVESGICYTKEQQIQSDHLLESKFRRNPKLSNNSKFQTLVRQMMHCEIELRPTADQLLEINF